MRGPRHSQRALPRRTRATAAAGAGAMALPDDIAALLPQTQCTRCGYEGCRPYSEAIASNLAPINQCPPGGSATIDALASLLHREAISLKPDNGIEGQALFAVIDEDRCLR